MVPYCEPCDKRWFDSFQSCVIVLVYNEFDEIVLSKQGYLSDEYTAFTSGFIKPGENAEECAVREVKEETGLDVSGADGGYMFTYRRDNPEEGDNYFVDVYKFEMDQ